MEAIQLKTVADLDEACLKNERIELIDGEIVKHPMARFDHSLAQSGLSGQFFPLWGKGDDDGWWIITEVSVRYSEHHCPSHDLAGWRKSRVPHPPSSVMDKRNVPHILDRWLRSHFPFGHAAISSCPFP